MKTLALALLASFLTLPAIAEEPHETEATATADEHGSERPENSKTSLEDEVLTRLDDPELQEGIKKDTDEKRKLELEERLGIQVTVKDGQAVLTTPDP